MTVITTLLPSDPFAYVDYIHGKTHIRSPVNGTTHVYTTGKTYGVNSWISIKIQQVKNQNKYIQSLIINDEEVIRYVNDDPKEFQYKNVYAGKFSVSDDTQPGFGRNLIIYGKCVSIFS